MRMAAFSLLPLALIACTQNEQARSSDNGALAANAIANASLPSPKEGSANSAQVTELKASLPSPASSAAAYCAASEEKWVEGCNASCTASWSGNDCPNSCTASPPPGYILVDHRVQMESENNGSHSASLIPAQSTFNYQASIKSAYKSAIDAAGKYNQYEAKGRLEEEMNNALEVAEGFNASHQTIRFEVRAHRQGNQLDRRRGWSRGKVDMKIKCAVPENLQQKLYEKYGLHSNV